jgi:hypothetical protein
VKHFARLLTLGFDVEADGTLSATLRNRVDRAIEHYMAGRIRTLIMSGGWSDPEPCPTATAMKAYAVGRGIRACEILEQADGLDTVGEAIFSRLLLPPMSVHDRLLIVTSEFHAARAAHIFRFVYGASFDFEMEAVPNGPDHETPSRASEAASLQLCKTLFQGIAPGDMSAILERFWRGHALYQSARHTELRQATFAALSAIQ